MNKNLEIWEDIFQNNEWGKYPSLAVVRFVARNFYKAPNRKDIRILELGCGTGANLWYCAREGFSVIGLDGSKTAIHRMIDRFEKENLSEFLMDIKVGNYYNLLNEIKDNSIDAIIDVGSLCCNSFLDTKEIIKKSFDKLKVGGKFLSQTFDKGSDGLNINDKEVEIMGGGAEKIEDKYFHAVFTRLGSMREKCLVRYTTYEDIFELYKMENNKIDYIHKEKYYFSKDRVRKDWIIELTKL